jgi:hypothetical protein
VHLVDAQSLAADRARGGQAVAGGHHHAHAALAQRASASGVVALTGSDTASRPASGHRRPEA